MKRIKVYVAGPYTAASPAKRTENVLTALDAGHLIHMLDMAAFVPHLSHYWNARHPADYESWMRWCLAWLETCDVVLRIPGASPGADREVERAKELRIPIVYRIGELRKWRKI